MMLFGVPRFVFAAYAHESAGLPPAAFVPAAADGSTVDALSALGQASLTTEWGRQGHTFVRAGGWKDPKHALVYLDAAHAAGVSVLWNVAADTLAFAMIGKVNTKTNKTGDPVELWKETAGNVTAVMSHPAIGGYYACDDCCHMPTLDAFGDAEYRALAKIKAMIREIDPYHLMFGTIACGETWYWSEEGRCQNPPFATENLLENTGGVGAPTPLLFSRDVTLLPSRCLADACYLDDVIAFKGAGLGMDVMMKEGYGGGIGGFGPFPSQFRVFPMTYEPLVLMPDPAALRTPATLRSHNYAGAVAAGMFHTNAFVMNNGQFFNWQQATGLSTWCAEASELLPAWMSAAKWLGSSDPVTAALAVAATATAEVTFPPQQQGKRAVVGVYVEETAAGVATSAGYRCMSVVVVNSEAMPVGVAVNISGVGVLPPGTSGTVARRIFNGDYAINLTAATLPKTPAPKATNNAAGDDGAAMVYSFNDFVDGGTTNVYRIGCDVERALPPPPTPNWMVDGGFEASADLRTPGIFNAAADTYAPTLSCTRTNVSDDRYVAPLVLPGRVVTCSWILPLSFCLFFAQQRDEGYT